MDFFNITKISITIITSIITLIIAFRVLLFNRKDWFNRWFAIFFISSSLGFLFYTIYHMILNNAQIVIPLMIIAQLFFNFNSISLTMTVFVLEKFTKVAMSFRFFGRLMILYLIMSIGYLILIPELDTEAYALGLVNTKTNLGLLLFVNTIRIILSIYAAYKYTVISKKIVGETKKKVVWFTKGVNFIIVGLLTNLIAAIFASYIQISIEILALIFINVGAFLILYGFII